MDETILLRAAMTGDLNAYNRLVLSYQDEIYTLVYYLDWDEQSVCEVVQCIFLLAFQRLHMVNGSGFRNFLFHCAVQTCRAQWKQYKQASSETFAQTNGEGKKTNEQRLRFYLGGLHPDLRLALALVDLAGLEYPQAAEVLGISVQKLSQQLAMARVQISHEMER